MRKINLCLYATTLLWMVACKKSTVTPAAPGKILFTAERFGPGEFKAMEDQAYVKITGSTPNVAFTYELSGAEGVNEFDGPENYVGAGMLDNKGNADIIYATADGDNPFKRYKDGEITIKVKLAKGELKATTIKEEFVIRDAADFINIDEIRVHSKGATFVQEADF